MAAAAVGSPVQDLRNESTCSICLDYFKDPVTIPECGHNFCRSCLIRCWGESEAEASCPRCSKTVQQKNLIPNRQLANIVELIKKLSLQAGKEEREKGKVCKEHRKPLKLFCKEDEAPICVVCGKSKEHENHKVIPLEEAYEEYKGLISSRLQILRREREKFLAYQADLEKESQDLLKLTETERQKTVEKLGQLRQFLEEQEKHLLNQIEDVEERIARERDEQLARFSGELSSLERSIQELEEKRQKPANELLQDVRSTLQRYEKRENQENPLAFFPELKKRISEFCDINILVEDVMEQFEDALLFKEQLQEDDPLLINLQRANVTLDPDTAHPNLILSEDRKSVRYGDKEQDLPDNPERFNSRTSVLGHEGFTAGCHFWEVTVESEGKWVYWTVGVTRKSAERKGDFALSSDGGIWAVGKSGGEYMAFDPPDYLPLSLFWEPKRIRVTLDYEGEEVSFSDADSGTELYTFSGAPFSGDTILPFFHLSGDKTHFRIS
ncbi:zinc finger protein RFP-like [Lacerta agilis]|uniref:zinc finger protein RFP-like n=1 Tax=Lacerta agilis TaxID=80427 RepID=UPI00141A663E|nr:zinc finger protein RFP-like [Lacerta agilis]